MIPNPDDGRTEGQEQPEQAVLCSADNATRSTPNYWRALWSSKPDSKLKIGKAQNGGPQRAIYVYLAIIVIVWAGNWPMLKMVLADIGPFSFTAFRLFGAAVLIGAVLAASGQRVLPSPEERLPLAVCGFFQMGAMLGLSLFGLQFVNAGRAAVLAYTMQLWALPFGMIILRERPPALKIVGALIGFVGLILFFNPSLMDWSNGRVLFGNSMLLLAAAAWALGATLYRRRTFTTSFFAQTGWQLFVGSLPLLLAAFLLENIHPIRWSRFLLLFLVFNWVIGIAFAYWCWTRVLNELSASTAGQVLMLVPILAYFLSVIIFGEAMTWDALVSVALIMCGVALTFRSVASERRV